MPFMYYFELLFAVSTSTALSVLVTVSIIFFFIWMAEVTGHMPTSHPMDYVPVFVSMKKNNTHWKLDYALWDRWHYDTGSTRNLFDCFRILEQGGDYERVPLTIDNSWHSMSLGEPNELKWANGSITDRYMSQGNKGHH